MCRYSNLPGKFRVMRWAASRRDYLVLYHVEPDERGPFLRFKMAPNSVLHHSFKLLKGIGLGEDVIAEGSGYITTFRGFLCQKDDFLFHGFLLYGA